jgi:hypothetical protein
MCIHTKRPVFRVSMVKLDVALMHHRRTEESQCVELFCDKADILESERVEFRCTECHADGAMKDEIMPKEEKERKFAEEDNKRDMCYTAAKPTARPEFGDDVRMLHFDLKRCKQAHHIRKHQTSITIRRRARSNRGSNYVDCCAQHLKKTKT